MRYNPATIEPRWQQYWEQHQTFAAPAMPTGEKLYVLDMFPYPSGNGLHVGHPEGYTATDIVCRYSRMIGKSVMHPMGWDAFGLPAEQHAKKTGTPPRITTNENINTFRRQLKMLGFSYDWQRELATTDVGYFRWTQWIFLVLFDTWFDSQQQRGRPITELPIPDDVKKQGETAIRRYQDEHRLAYQIEAPVNWCPELATVLSNEEVIGGVSERGGHPVVRLPLRQWMLRITAYADRLESDLANLDWSEGIKALQRNWIGRSTGAEVDFLVGEAAQDGSGKPSAIRHQPSDVGDQSKIQNQESKIATAFPRKPSPDALRVYTTRPDTLFGATYMVIAPEHPQAERLTTAAQAAEVKAYCEKAARKSDLDRTDLAKDKSGVFTGSYAINPVNGQAIPIWIADYVLMGYGTGAIMAVPAHDERDFEFAARFNLPIVAVVDAGANDPHRADYLACKQVFSGQGTAINSGEYDGLPTAKFKDKITADLAAAGLGRQAVNYKLRDWLFSRQHFWGEPFPVLRELDADGQPTGLVRVIPPESLPVDLPELSSFESHGTADPPLEQAPADWLYPVIDGVKYKRETNTMPQWAGSCWYYLRFLDPNNAGRFIDPAIEKAWMPVDLYIGGAEHAVLHLLYSRFWHKVLFDRGHVSMPEPFQKLVNQGMILGEPRYFLSKEDSPDAPQEVPEADVEIRAGKPFQKGTDNELAMKAEKMSKSRGNVVNPDDVVKEYGADALRLYEMFMGPLEAVKPWSMKGVNGVRGFLDRVWRMIVNDRAEDLLLNAAVQDAPATEEQARVLHRTIKGVTEDIEKLAFNTAIAKMMEFTNFFTKCDVRPQAAMESLVLLLSPFAPHMAEELWQLLGHSQTLAYHAWPTYDESLIKEQTVEIPVQINGKLRGRIVTPADADAAALEAAARADEKVAEQLAGKTVVK
ncbi:MAG: leucine--tRNA ligase, partial [Pirellulales bacterium]